MKPITERIDSISIFKDGSKYGGNWYKKDTMLIVANTGNSYSPITYIHKPKHISAKDWNIIKEKLQISLLK